MNANLRKVVIIVAVLNLAYLGVEFVVALAIGSVSLCADSVYCLEDPSVNLLIAITLDWSASSWARVGMHIYSGPPRARSYRVSARESSKRARL